MCAVESTSTEGGAGRGGAREERDIEIWVRNGTDITVVNVA